MRYQRRNAARDDLINADRHLSEIHSLSLGRTGIYNGQFTEGPVASNPWPDGWEFYSNGSNTIVRTNTDSIAGAHCIQGTCNVGATWVGYMLQQKFMPVSALSTFCVYVSTLASGAAITVRWGMACYTAAKAWIGLAIAYNAAPGAAWVETMQQMGAAGTAFAANTRYVRFYLDFNDQTAASWVRVDNIYINEPCCGVAAAEEPLIILSKSSAVNQNVGGADGTEVWWTWNGEIRKDTGYTHSNAVNPSRVQVDADGWYHVRFCGNAEQTGAARTTLQGIIRVNGGATQRLGTIRDYTRGSAYGNVSPGLDTILELSNGDYIEVGTRVEDTDGVYTLNSNDGTEILNDENQLTLVKVSDPS